MKVDCSFEPFSVSVAVGSTLESLYLSIHAFCTAIVGFQNYCVNNSPQVFFDHLGHLRTGSSRHLSAQLSHRFHALIAQARDV